MRDHEKLLRAFVDELTRRGLTEDQLAELLDHLYCSIEQRVAAGAPPASATLDAIAAVGDVVGLTREYMKGGLMHPLQKLLGIAVALAFVFAAVVLEGGHASYLVSRRAVVPLLLIVGVTIGGLVASFGTRCVGQLLAVALLGRHVAVDQVSSMQRMCQRGQRLVWTGCLLSVACSAICILAVLDSPHMIGPGLGSLLLAVVYSALFADLGFGSAERWIAQQAAERGPLASVIGPLGERGDRTRRYVTGPRRDGAPHKPRAGQISRPPQAPRRHCQA